MTHFRADRPNNALPPLPPVVDTESPEILRACIRAARSLADMNATSRIIPNPRILLQTLPFREARYSSEIENVVTTTDDMFRALALGPASADPGTREVLRYREALNLGMRSVNGESHFSVDLIEAVCSRIRDAETGLRHGDEGVQLVNRRTREIVYAPPNDPEIIRARIDNLVDYLNNGSSADPLIKMAVAHYQFEAIHPFDDGNGRTGRILNILYLVRTGLLDQPILYLSRFFLRSRPRYYELLRAVTVEGDWEEWILYMLYGVERMSITLATS